MQTITRPRGVVPRERGCNLPPEFAEVATNMNLSTGRWEPWRQPLQVVQFPFDVKTAHIRDCCWAGVPECDARYVDAGVCKKTYLTGAGKPLVTDSLCDQSWTYLGFPIPGSPVGITDPCHSVDSGPDMEQRRYIITYCSECEEGPASCPSEVVIAKKDTRVALALPEDPDPMWGATHVNIYRQAATWDVQQGLTTFEDNDLSAGWAGSETDTDWFRVAQLPIEARAWIDDNKAELGQLLTTEDYFPPADDLEIVGETDVGSLVGFTGQEVWFSERNVYHAWPLKGRHYFGAEVLDVCIIGNTVMVFTCESVWVLEEAEDCTDASCRNGREVPVPAPAIGRRACLPTPTGGLYVSREGLHRVSPDTQVTTVSIPAFDKEDWSQLGPKTMRLEMGCDHLFLITCRGVYVWEMRFDEAGLLPPDVSMLSFTVDQFLRDEKDHLYFIAGNAAYQFNAGAEHLQMDWLQVEQRTDRPQTLSGIRGEYVKKRNVTKNTVQLFSEGKVICSKPLREGGQRVRGQRSRCFQLQVKGTEPMCGFGYGAGLTQGENREQPRS